MATKTSYRRAARRTARVMERAQLADMIDPARFSVSDRSTRRVAR